MKKTIPLLSQLNYIKLIDNLNWVASLSWTIQKYIKYQYQIWFFRCIHFNDEYKIISWKINVCILLWELLNFHMWHLIYDMNLYYITDLFAVPMFTFLYSLHLCTTIDALLCMFKLDFKSWNAWSVIQWSVKVFYMHTCKHIQVCDLTR